MRRERWKENCGDFSECTMRTADKCCRKDAQTVLLRVSRALAPHWYRASAGVIELKASDQVLHSTSIDVENDASREAQPPRLRDSRLALEKASLSRRVGHLSFCIPSPPPANMQLWPGPSMPMCATLSCQTRPARDLHDCAHRWQRLPQVSIWARLGRETTSSPVTSFELRFSAAHDFVKPNDPRGLELMNAAARHVMQELKGSVLMAFGESDEYSFLLSKACNLYSRRSRCVCA